MKPEKVNLEEMPQAVHEEEIIALLSRYTKRMSDDGSEINDDAHAKEMESIHANLSRCPIFPIYVKYKDGKILTLNMLQNSVETAVDIIDNYIKNELDTKKKFDRHDIESLNKTKKILMGRIHQIRSCVNSYVQSIGTFHNLKTLRCHEGRDFNKQFENADLARRRKHNSLIESLQVFRKALNQVRNLSNEIDVSQNKLIMFSEKVLDNRDLIRDWAIAAYFHEQLQSIRDKMESR